MLKSIVAQKAMRMLYSNLPDEAQLLLCYPESLTKEHNSKAFLSDMKNFVFKTIELDKTVSLFYHFFPELKQGYRQFFSSLSVIRNVSVHASVPTFQRYELERIAYFSTKLFLHISELNLFKYYTFTKDTKIENFLEYYEDEKVKKVKAALDTARDTVKKGNLSDTGYSSEDWESICEQCPICGNSATYYGETEESTDNEGVLHLLFQCESFSCEACGLELDDYEELELAGMDTSIEREDDVELWASEHDYYDDQDERW